MNDTLCTKEEKTLNETKDELTVCFVCSGNTCRSPMAEAWLNYVGKKRGLRAVSAGIVASGFAPISSAAVEALEKFGVPCTKDSDYKNHVSTPVSSELFDKCDRIIGMTSKHTMLLIMHYPEFASKISSFPTDVPDPFGESTEVYCDILEIIKNGILCEFGV